MLKSANRFVCHFLLVMAAIPLAASEPASDQFIISTQRIVDAMAFAGIAVSPDQIELLSQTNRAPADATMRVVSVSNGTAGTDTFIAKLRCGDNHQCLPFYVLVHGMERLNEGSVGAPALPAIKASSMQNIIRGGDHAILTFETPDSRMSFPVICLQSGMRGQRIRTASLDRKRFYDAEIVGAGLLKGTL